MVETNQGVRGTNAAADTNLGAAARRFAGLQADGPGSRKIVQTANDRLKRNSSLARDAVCCEFQAGVLSLYGRLRTYYQKQVAQEAVRGLEGVQRVVNHIEVAS